MGFIAFSNVPFKLRLKTEKMISRITSKKKASFLFRSSLDLNHFFGLLYLGWESNPHSVARTGF